MALTREQAIALAERHAENGLALGTYRYGEGRYVFAKVRKPDLRILGDSDKIVVDEETGKVYTGSSAPMFCPRNFGIYDFDGNVITPIDVNPLPPVEDDEDDEYDDDNDGEELIEIVPVSGFADIDYY